MKEKIATKFQLKLLIFMNIFTLITIGVIIYELSNKLPRFASFIMLGLVFCMMAANQFIYYKNNRDLINLIKGIIFSILGLSLIVYRIFF